jgi:homoserine O-acetyltransferase
VAGLGLVETQRVVLFTKDDPLVLESGATLAPVEVAYETYGELDADGGNAVFLAHALTGDAHAAGHHGDPARRGWFDLGVGPGRMVDTDRFFVVCPNLLGGCQGTTGPSSAEPGGGRAYGLRFPQFTVRDLVTMHRRLLAHLGVERLYAGVGGSLGGMQILQWALDHPDEIERAVLVCASARLTAQNIAFSKTARTAIAGDPEFHGGEYLNVDPPTRPDQGMRVARMLAHITYVSEESLRRKFDRERRGGPADPMPASSMTFATDFEVESYLDHQADVFLERFDALSYLYLSRVMDYFAPFADPRVDLAALATRFLLVSFDTDWRFGTEHSRFVAEQLAAGGVDVAHHEVRSPWGHDSFLLDVPEYHALVRDFL